MSEILVNLTSTSAQTTTDSFVDVTGLEQSSVTVASTADVLLMIAVVGPLRSDSGGDRVAAFRFAVDDTLEGPELTCFHDNADEGCVTALCWAKTGISGSHKFAVQVQSHSSKHMELSTTRIRSFQVIAITDATILVNKTSTAADDAVAGYTTIVDLDDTQTVTAGSVLLVLGNIQPELSGVTNGNFGVRLTIAGTHEGPELLTNIDSSNEGCGNSMMWVKDGISGSTAFTMEWDEDAAEISADTGRVRSLQVIEITANANKLAAQVGQTADVLTTAYTDVLDMKATITVDGTDAILLFAASVGHADAGTGDETMNTRFYESTTGEGPEGCSFHDSATEACGHSTYWAATGKSAGSHTFSLRAKQISDSGVDIDDARNRSLAIVELTAAAAVSQSHFEYRVPAFV